MRLKLWLVFKFFLVPYMIIYSNEKVKSAHYRQKKWPYFCVGSSREIDPHRDDCLVNQNFVREDDRLITEFEVNQVYNGRLVSTTRVVQAVEYSNVLLNCTTFNRLYNETVIWERDGNPITVGPRVLQSDMVQLIYKNSTKIYPHSQGANENFEVWMLVVEYMTRSQAEMSSYKCLIANRPDQRILFHVKLLDPPKHTFESSKKMLKITDSGKAFENEALNISCSMLISTVKSSRMVLEWAHLSSKEVTSSLKNFNPLSTNLLSQLEMSKSLKIVNLTHSLIIAQIAIPRVQTNDAGLYRCRAFSLPLNEDDLKFDEEKSFDHLIDFALYNLEVRRKWPYSSVGLKANALVISNYVEKLNRDLKRERKFFRINEVQLNDDNTNSRKAQKKIFKGSSQDMLSSRMNLNNGSRKLDYFTLVIISVNIFNIFCT